MCDCKVQTSESIAKLTEALAAAQGEMAAAKADSKNPHFNAAYADLASCWEAVRKPLASHGLAIVQLPATDGAKVTVTTILSHVSGEWIKSSLTLTARDASPQPVGACITYARRYGLVSMVGVAQEDDDGNANSVPQGSGKTYRAPEPSPPPEPPSQDEQETIRVMAETRSAEGMRDVVPSIRLLSDTAKKRIEPLVIAMTKRIIEGCETVPDLEKLIPLIKQLPVDTQRRIKPIFEGHKRQLTAADAAAMGA